MDNFDPAKVTMQIISTSNSFPVRGWADGQMFTIEFDTEQFSKHVGTGGAGRHIESKDKSGTGTIRLADYSPTNDELNDLANTKETFTVQCTDKTTKQGAGKYRQCHIFKKPDFTKDAVSFMNEWQISFIKGEITHSGAKNYDA